MSNAWRGPFGAIVLFLIVWGAVLTFSLATILVEQRAEVHHHRVRNEVEHGWIRGLNKCTLALPPAPTRTPKMIDECEKQARIKAEVDAARRFHMTLREVQDIS